MASTILNGKIKTNMLQSFLTLSEQIITFSNLKRPVSSTVTCYQQVMEGMAKNQEAFDQFVDQKLTSILKLEVPSQRMRRYPETRVIIKSIALADKSEEKVCLLFILNVLLTCLFLSAVRS